MSDQQTKSKLFAPILTGLTSLSLLFGIIDLLVYYSYFNFNVFEYMEIGEVVTHIIKDAALLIPIYLITTVVKLLTMKGEKTTTVSEEIDKRGEETNTVTEPIRQRKKVKLKSFLNHLFTILIVSAFTYYFYNGRMSRPMYFGILVTIGAFYIFELPSILDRKILELLSYRFTTWDRISLLLVILTIYSSVLVGTYNAGKVMDAHNSFGDYITLSKDSLVKSDSTYYYIGKTNKFIFFYHSKAKHVDVFPESEVKKYSIH